MEGSKHNKNTSIHMLGWSLPQRQQEIASSGRTLGSNRSIKRTTIHSDTMLARSLFFNSPVPDHTSHQEVPHPIEALFTVRGVTLGGNAARTGYVGGLDHMCGRHFLWRQQRHEHRFGSTCRMDGRGARSGALACNYDLG